MPITKKRRQIAKSNAKKTPSAVAPQGFAGFAGSQK
jgi:hypothetical protein